MLPGLNEAGATLLEQLRKSAGGTHLFLQVMGNRQNGSASLPGRTPAKAAHGHPEGGGAPPWWAAQLNLHGFGQLLLIPI